MGVQADMEGSYLIKRADQPVPDETPSESQCSASADKPEITGCAAFWENMRISEVSIISGPLNGYAVGFPGVYNFLHGPSTDCSLCHRKMPCRTLSNAKGAWRTDATGDYCGWATDVTCGHIYFTAASCQADKGCHWNYSAAGAARTRPASAPATPASLSRPESLAAFLAASADPS